MSHQVKPDGSAHVKKVVFKKPEQVRQQSTSNIFCNPHKSGWRSGLDLWPEEAQRHVPEELGEQDEAHCRSEDSQNCKVRFFRSLTNPFSLANKLGFRILIFSLLGMSSKHPLLWRERTKRENLQKIIKNQRRISKKMPSPYYPKHSVINSCYLLLVFISYRSVKTMY